MCRLSVELKEHEWNFGRTRNAVGTRSDRRSILDQINIFLINL